MARSSELRRCQRTGALRRVKGLYEGLNVVCLDTEF